VNNVVFIGTTKPALHAFSVDTGLPLWSADALVVPPRPGYVLGPAIVGNSVVIGVAARRDAGALHVYSL
jgi:hypothetical protein